MRCPSLRDRFARRFGDLDFAGRSGQSREIGHVFEGRGYAPRERFNAVHGMRRLIFDDVANRRRVDVFLDVFEMCHRLDLRERLEIDRCTLTLADLLATKLQIVEMNEKDLNDMTGMLLDHDVGESDSPETINGRYLAEICSEDWGMNRTFEINLDRIIGHAAKVLGDEEAARVAGRVRRLAGTIRGHRKGLGWSMRAKLGERVRWYEIPEAWNDGEEREGDGLAGPGRAEPGRAR